jgi:hypothetical protein
MANEEHVERLRQGIYCLEHMKRGRAPTCAALILSAARTGDGIG